MGNSKKVRIFAALCLLAALSFYPLPFSLSPISLSARAESTLVSTATREGRLAVFDDAWSRINERYYDRTFHGLDWDAQRTTFRSLAAEASSSQELYAVLRRMIASLDDPHTRVFAPEEKFDWWRPRFVSTGISIAEVDGLPTVVQVERGSAPQRAGVRPGDVIETVNGEAALPLVNNRLTKLSAPASASSRFRAFAKLLDGPPKPLSRLVGREKTANKSLPDLIATGSSASLACEDVANEERMRSLRLTRLRNRLPQVSLACLRRNCPACVA